MCKLSQEQRVRLISELGNDTTGTIINQDRLIDYIANLASSKINANCTLKKFELDETKVDKISQKLRSEFGYLIKDSTLKYIIEKYVNELKICDKPRTPIE